ncbi:hypothetical protein [Miltoncostaea marina]|uniref:hypothetical protein n=1 Tax=Miltoncostaea marina TaxID=2843215 RepID=UPI001C3C81EC|nr:hypothetical protein [Miltoncostaea marina]
MPPTRTATHTSPIRRLGTAAAAGCLALLCAGAVAAGAAGGGSSVGVIGVVAAKGPPGPAPMPLARGDAKTACIYSHNSIREMRMIGRRIGRDFRCASVYNNVGTWAAWTNPWFITTGNLDNRWADWVRADPGRRRLVIGQSMIPTEGMPADWRRKGARGAYDARIRELSRNLVRAGLGRSVIRLGYEANGDWNADHVGHTARDHAHWRAYWARFTRVMNAVPGARFTFDWNLNAAYRDIPLRAIYPGDRAVDIIGVDVYDESGRALPAARSPRRWSAIAAQPGGVRDIVRFARARGKPLSVPEWGLIHPSGRGGGDNPRFVAAIAALVRNNTVAYQSYFNNDQLEPCLEIHKQRRAFAAYRAHFGGASARHAAAGRPTARRS